MSRHISKPYNVVFEAAGAIRIELVTDILRIYIAAIAAASSEETKSRLAMERDSLLISVAGISDDLMLALALSLAKEEPDEYNNNLIAETAQTNRTEITTIIESANRSLTEAIAQTPDSYKQSNVQGWNQLLAQQEQIGKMTASADRLFDLAMQASTEYPWS